MSNDYSGAARGGSPSVVAEAPDGAGERRWEARMSAYDEIGGAGAVRAAVSVFYQRVLDDPDLQQWFAETDLGRLKAHQRAFLSKALGGPDLFAGRSMAEAHANLEITDEAFDAVVEHLTITLHDLGVEGDLVAGVRETVESLRADVVSARPAPADR